LECREIWFSRHAIERMFERGISPEVIRGVVESGEAIALYGDDKPHPSALLLGFLENRAIHVVVARDPDSYRCHVVTVYVPTPELWGDDFKTRRRS
jgi:hypothetical protein